MKSFVGYWCQKYVLVVTSDDLPSLIMPTINQKSPLKPLVVSGHQWPCLQLGQGSKITALTHCFQNYFWFPWFLVSGFQHCLKTIAFLHMLTSIHCINTVLILVLPYFNQYRSSLYPVFVFIFLSFHFAQIKLFEKASRETDAEHLDSGRGAGQNIGPLSCCAGCGWCG